MSFSSFHASGSIPSIAASIASKLAVYESTCLGLGNPECEHNSRSNIANYLRWIIHPTIATVRNVRVVQRGVLSVVVSCPIADTMRHVIPRSRLMKAPLEMQSLLQLRTARHRPGSDRRQNHQHRHRVRRCPIARRARPRLHHPKELHPLGNNFSDVAFVPFFIVITAGTNRAFEIDLAAFGRYWPQFSACLPQTTTLCHSVFSWRCPL